LAPRDLSETLSASCAAFSLETYPLFTEPRNCHNFVLGIPVAKSLLNVFGCSPIMAICYSPFRRGIRQPWVRLVSPVMSPRQIVLAVSSAVIAIATAGLLCKGVLASEQTSVSCLRCRLVSISILLVIIMIYYILICFSVLLDFKLGTRSWLQLFEQ
jgi:TctA family transporter